MTIDEKDGDFHSGFEEYEPFDPSAPEKSLLRAILMSALNDLRKSGEPRRRATEFFLNKDDSYIFSFVAICDHLSVDPSKVLFVTGLAPGAPAVVAPTEELAKLLPEEEQSSGE